MRFHERRRTPAVRVLVRFVLAAFGFDEPRRDLVGFVLSLVQTKHGAVGSAKMAHLRKGSDPPPDEATPACGQLAGAEPT
jgi:hypothetical protein